MARLLHFRAGAVHVGEPVHQQARLLNRSGGHMRDAVGGHLLEQPRRRRVQDHDQPAVVSVPAPSAKP